MSGITPVTGYRYFSCRFSVKHASCLKHIDCCTSPGTLAEVSPALPSFELIPDIVIRNSHLASRAWAAPLVRRSQGCGLTGFAGAGLGSCPAALGSSHRDRGSTALLEGSNCGEGLHHDPALRTAVTLARGLKRQKNYDVDRSSKSSFSQQQQKKPPHF